MCVCRYSLASEPTCFVRRDAALYILNVTNVVLMKVQTLKTFGFKVGKNCHCVTATEAISKIGIIYKNVRKNSRFYSFAHCCLTLFRSANIANCLLQTEKR